jgi:hypothetical protein
LTAILSTIFTNIQSLGTGLQGVAKSFSGTFNSLPMLAIALIGFGLAAISYKNSINQNRGGSGEQQDRSQNDNNDAEGEIEDDEL